MKGVLRGLVVVFIAWCEQAVKSNDRVLPTVRYQLTASCFQRFFDLNPIIEFLNTPSGASFDLILLMDSELLGM